MVFIYDYDVKYISFYVIIVIMCMGGEEGGGKCFVFEIIYLFIYIWFDFYFLN